MQSIDGIHKIACYFLTGWVKSVYSIDTTLADIMTRFPEPKGASLGHSEVGGFSMLVDPAKSRRLREISQGKSTATQKPPKVEAVAVESGNPFDLPPDVLDELQRARQIIDDEISRIMSFFPEGRKKSLFKLRFGTVEEIKSMDVQAIFKLLKLDYRRAKLNRLQKINYYGEKVS
jgi:hypothetical protein